MRWSLPLLLLFSTARALAQGAPPPSVKPEEPVIGGEAPRLREPGAEFRWQAPPEPGACIGGSCGVMPVPAQLAAPIQRDLPDVHPRQRFAYTGAVLGAVSAGLVLGSSIAIAVADDRDSERITRGVWLGYFTLGTGLVALSAQLARRELGGSSEASKATRRLGWTAFALALADGAVLWAGSFRGFDDMTALTIGAGAIGACALLPHALDAYVAGRGLRYRQVVSLEPSFSGLRVRF